uniref:Uncharacterized protein n=1 Tax=Escherichia coli TaxID=562 RepID=A0A1B2RBY9_ECOLX|nr:hypothetical protein [Escherichia coli]
MEILQCHPRTALIFNVRDDHLWYFTQVYEPAQSLRDF